MRKEQSGVEQGASPTKWRDIPTIGEDVAADNTGPEPEIFASASGTPVHQLHETPIECSVPLINKRTSFYDLPRELRDMIYEKCDEELIDWFYESQTDHPHPLLLTSLQVCSELMIHLYRKCPPDLTVINCDSDVLLKWQRRAKHHLGERKFRNLKIFYNFEGYDRDNLIEWCYRVHACHLETPLEVSRMPITWLVLCALSALGVAGSLRSTSWEICYEEIAKYVCY